MKILEYIEKGNRVLVSVLYDDNTFATLNMLSTGNHEEILKDVYIISNDVRNRQPFEGEIPVDIEIWNPPTSVATTMTVDFYNLTGKVYNQYGEEMMEVIDFSVTGAAIIEDGALKINEVSEDTSFLITASVGELTETYEGIAYAKVEQQEPSDLQLQIEALKKEIDILTGVTE